MAKGPGGIISGGFQPLKAPDAPTIDSVSAGVLTADVTFSAPADTGEGSVDSYVITAKQGDGTSVSNTASAAGTVSLTLTAGGTTTFAAQAISNAFGPGQFSGFGNSTSVFSGQELYGWGRGTDGQTGQDNTINRSSPAQVGALANWSQVSASSGGGNSAAVTTTGELYAWGNNQFGQVGDGTVINRSSPVQVGALTNWSQVSFGSFMCIAVKTDGTLWSWGRDLAGQLGQSTYNIHRSSPTQIGSLTTWSQVDSDAFNCFAIKTDGTLWSWGSRDSGQNGHNDFITKSSPIQIGALTNWAQVSAGEDQTAAITTTGELYAWGKNSIGAVGDNTTITRSSPVQIGALTNWSQVDAGRDFCSAVKTDGTLWSWGEGNNGRTGQGNEIDLSSPVQVGSLTNWSQTSAGSYHCMAVKTDNTLWAWGDNGFGQRGLNIATVEVSSPTQVGALTSWTQVSAGVFHTVALFGTTS